MAVAGEADISTMEPTEGVPTKKRRFFNFKSIRKLFTSRKKGKTKRHDKVTTVGVKARSTSDVIEAQKVLEEEQNSETNSQLSNKNLSASHESVFKNRRDTSLDPLGSTRSMTAAIPKKAFTNELRQKVRARRKDDDSDDEPLASSPADHTTTADVQVEARLKSSHLMASDQSLLSTEVSDTDTAEDLFADKWTRSGAPNRSQSPEPLSDADLDLVMSSSSLNVAPLLHRCKVRPKRQRPAKKQRPTSASPKPPVGGVHVMPTQERENRPTTPSGDSQTDDHEVIPKRDSEEIEVDREGSGLSQDLPYGERLHKSPIGSSQELKISPTGSSEVLDAGSRSKELQDGIVSSPSTDDLKDVFSSGSIDELKGLSSEGSSQEVLQSSMTEISPKHSPENSESESNIRRKVSPTQTKRSSDSRHRTKRNTIAGSAETTVFGERKINQRSSLVEGDRNCGNLAKLKDRDMSVDESTEFAQIFNKVKRNSTPKLLENEDGCHGDQKPVTKENVETQNVSKMPKSLKKKILIIGRQSTMGDSPRQSISSDTRHSISSISAKGSIDSVGSEGLQTGTGSPTQGTADDVRSGSQDEIPPKRKKEIDTNDDEAENKDESDISAESKVLTQQSEDEQTRQTPSGQKVASIRDIRPISLVMSKRNKFAKAKSRTYDSQNSSKYFSKQGLTMSQASVDEAGSFGSSIDRSLDKSPPGSDKATPSDQKDETVRSNQRSSSKTSPCQSPITEVAGSGETSPAEQSPTEKSPNVVSSNKTSPGDSSNKTSPGDSSPKETSPDKKVITFSRNSSKNSPSDSYAKVNVSGANSASPTELSPTERSVSSSSASSSAKTSPTDHAFKEKLGSMSSNASSNAEPAGRTVSASSSVKSSPTEETSPQQIVIQKRDSLDDPKRNVAHRSKSAYQPAGQAKVERRRLASEEDASAARKLAPVWIAMAKRKTQGWQPGSPGSTSDKEANKENIEQTVDSDSALNKRSSVYDMIRKFQVG